MEKNHKPKLEMGWGNSSYLETYWQDVDLNSYFPKTPIDLAYEMTASEQVKLAIKALHLTVGNVNIDNKHIVIGNGATQLISAFMHIFNLPVYANSPYYLQFTGLAKFNNLEFLKETNKPCLQIHTVPNNPDNSVDIIEKSNLKIFDLSYNWPQYSPILEEFDENVMIFSLSKSTGHCSSRFGWAFIRDGILAKEVERYVELTTCGVSKESQKLFIAIVNREMGRNFNVFDYAKIELATRWDAIEGRKKNLPFKVLNNSGMFLWCQGVIPENINGINGLQFGSDENHFRLNLGCDKVTFKKFISQYE